VLNVAAKPVRVSPTICAGRTMATGKRRPQARTNCSAPNLLCSYRLLNPESTRSSSEIAPMRMPATYAVETWTKRSRPPLQRAASANSSMFAVPSTFTVANRAAVSFTPISAATCTICVTSRASFPYRAASRPNPSCVISPATGTMRFPTAFSNRGRSRHNRRKRASAAASDSARTRAYRRATPASSKPSSTKPPRNPLAPVMKAQLLLPTPTRATSLHPAVCDTLIAYYYIVRDLPSDAAAYHGIQTVTIYRHTIAPAARTCCGRPALVRPSSGKSRLPAFAL